MSFSARFSMLYSQRFEQNSCKAQFIVGKLSPERVFEFPVRSERQLCRYLCRYRNSGEGFGSMFASEALSTPGFELSSWCVIVSM